MKKLTIHLCGPLQSYSYGDCDRIKRTRQEPTHSAITGMIAACGGIKRKDPKLDEISNSFKIEKIRKLKTPKYIGDETDHYGYYKILTDFQIAKSTKECPIFMANGKMFKENDNIIEKKEYLMDAYFQVTIVGEDNVIEKYEKWFDDPCWAPYLGRKCCIPSLPFIIH